MVKIGIIGAGIIGLSSAVSLQQEFPEAEITLISDKFSGENITSDGAAGIWGPYLLGDTPPENIYRWSKATHEFFRDLYQSEDGGKLGISMLPCMRVSSSQNYPEPNWKDIVYGFRVLTEKELQGLGKASLRKGFAFTTFTCESRKLLPHFLKKFQNAGGKVVRKLVEDLKELRHEFEIVVNATGLGAHKLVPDLQVQPKRGQILRVLAPDVKWAILDDDDDGNYIIPNQDFVVLGGTHQEGDWNCNSYADDTEFIREGCERIIPSLKDAPVLDEWVGLRPGRTSVRLEMETLHFPGEKPYFLCSNYGHGGSGVTVSWGCAKDVTDLVKKVISQLHNSKL